MDGYTFTSSVVHTGYCKRASLPTICLSSKCAARGIYGTNSRQGFGSTCGDLSPQVAINVTAILEHVAEIERYIRLMKEKIWATLRANFLLSFT